MPTVSILMIRTALIWLVLTVTAGALLLTVKTTGWWPEGWTMRAPHIEAGLVGWFLLLIMGVAWWMLPRIPWWHYRRGHPVLAWSAYSLLNAGMVLIMLNPAAVILGRIGVVLYVVAIISFVAGIWPRAVSLREKLHPEDFK